MPKNLICFGDSITESGRDVQWGWTTLLLRMLDHSHPGQFQLHNVGVGGNTTLHALDRFISDVQPLLPGIVFIEFGINDAYVFVHSHIPRLSCGEYVRNLGEIVRLVRAGGGEPVLIVNHPMTKQGGHSQGNGLTVEENIRIYNVALRQLAVELHAELIDLPKMAQERALEEQDFLAQDGVHLSNPGQSHYAQMVYDRFIEMHHA